MRAASRAVFAVCATVLLPACGASPSGVATPAPASSAPDQKTVTAAAPAGWDYHPKAAARLRARLTLPDGRWLLAGEQGERWIADPASGTASAAPVLAGEDIVAIAALPAGTFGFVGETGTLHVSKDPIGPFDEIVRADPAVVQVHGQGDKLIGVHADGTLVRSTDAGRSFAPMKYDGGRVFDAAVAADGRALLLAAPEQLWHSVDGVSFERIESRGLGIFQLGLDPAGDPAARGIRGGLVWRPGGKELQASSLVPFTSDYDLMTDPLPGASAAALASGGASVSDADYFGAIEPPKEGGRWSLAVGGLIGRARQVVPIEGSEECGRMLVTASQQQVVIACLTRSKSSQALIMPRVKLIVAARPGLVFESRAVNVVAEETQARIRLLPDGAVLATGMCRPGTRRICQVGAPIRLSIRHAGGTLRVDADEPAKAPLIAVQAPGVAISPDGRKVYLAARLLEERKLALLVSADGGKKFEPLLIDSSRVSFGEGVDAGKVLETAIPNQIGIDADGNVSLVIATSAGLLWLVADRDGRVGSSAIAPKEAPLIATAGRHALLYSAAKGELRASHDAGASFPQTFRMPKDMLRDGSDAAVIACVAEGCALGASFSWQGWSPAPAGLPANLAAQPDAVAARFRVPITCTAGEDWNTILGADTAPSAYEMDRNGIAWTAIVNDYETGRVSYAMARTLPEPKVETTTLLEPLQGETSAIAIRPQAEGVAVLRYGVQRDPEGDVNLEGPLRNVDVRWIDLWSPGVKRAKIASAGSLDSSEVAMDRPDRFTASVGMLSVATDGIFVCPHEQCTGPEGGAWFLDAAGRSQRVWTPVWPQFPWGNRSHAVRTEWIRADKQVVPIAFMPSNTAVLRARKADGLTRFEAMTLVPAVAEAQGWFARASWAMSKSDPTSTCAITVAHPDKPSAYARLLRFRDRAGVAEVIPAPMLAEAGDPPRACSPQQQATTHRIVVPADAGRRHPVRVETGNDAGTVWLLTDEATLYGKAGEGCVSMVHAVRWGGTGPALSAIVDLANLDKSWLFYIDSESSSELRWKSMRCAFDRTARLPDKLVAGSLP